jgi:hypothetical protein
MNAQGRLEFEKIQQELGYTPVQITLQREQATRAAAAAAAGQPAGAAAEQPAVQQAAEPPPAQQSGTGQ